jgi:hypothetical protein
MIIDWKRRRKHSSFAFGFFFFVFFFFFFLSFGCCLLLASGRFCDQAKDENRNFGCVIQDSVLISYAHSSFICDLKAECTRRISKSRANECKVVRGETLLTLSTTLPTWMNTVIFLYNLLGVRNIIVSISI